MTAVRHSFAFTILDWTLFAIDLNFISFWSHHG